MLFISSKTSSSQRVLGLPIKLLDMGFHLLIFCTILSSAMHSTWPSQFNLCFLINPIIFCPFNISLGACGWGEGVYRVLVGKPEGKRPLERPRRRWVDNIRVDLQEVGCGYMDWIGLAQDRDRWRTLVSAVMNLRVP